MRKREIEERIYEGRFLEAIEGIKLYSRGLPSPFNLDKVEELESDYLNMLRYLDKEDKGRDGFIQNLKKSLLKETDRLRLAQGLEMGTDKYFSLFYDFNRSLDDDHPEVGEPYLSGLLGRDKDTLDEAERKEFDDDLKNLFEAVWISARLNDEIMDSYSKAGDYVRQALTSAITLGLMYMWDETKVEWILKELAREDLTPNCLIRLAFGLVVAVTLHDKRMMLYADDFAPLLEKAFHRNGVPLDEVLRVLHNNYLVATATTDLTRKLDEKMPGIQAQSIEMMHQAAQEGEGGLQGIMDNKELRAEMESIALLEQKGYDTRFSMFRNFKKFPFFHDVVGWLLPFDEKQSDVAPKLGENASGTISMLLQVFHNTLCDSDMYSAVLGYTQFNISFQGSKEDLQRALEEKREYEREMDPDGMARLNEAAQNYLHTLYRLVKLYPFSGRRIYNFFDNPVTPKMTILRPYLPNYNRLALNALDFFTEKQQYKELLHAASLLDAYDGPNRDRLLRSAHAHYMLKEYIDATKDYERADLMGDLDPDSTLELALSYRSLGFYKKASELMERLRQEHGSKPDLVLRLAATFLEMKQFETAKPLLYEYEFKAQRPERALRPLAWTLFMLKEYSQSKAYYDRIERKNVTDYINEGYLLIAMQQEKEALECFRNAFRLSDADKGSVYETVAQDEASLAPHNITCSKVWLMMDLASLNKAN